MSLFSLVKTVMETNGWPTPVTQVSSSNDPNIRQCMGLANKALESVSYMKRWPHLIVSNTFQTVVGQEEYPLPPDFHHIISNACFNTTEYYNMRGSLSPADWIAHQLNLVPTRSAYRVYPKSKSIKITPAPQTVEDVIFEYVTKNLATNAAGDPIQKYVTDSDVSVLDESWIEIGLTWRWRQKKGLDYTAELAEFTATISTRYAEALALGESPIGGVPMYPPLTDGYLGPNYNNYGPSYGT